VGAFARTLAHPDTVLGLLAARTPDQVVALAALDAVELPSQLTVRDVMTAQAITVGPDRTPGRRRPADGGARHPRPAGW